MVQRNFENINTTLLYQPWSTHNRHYKVFIAKCLTLAKWSVAVSYLTYFPSLVTFKDIPWTNFWATTPYLANYAMGTKPDLVVTGRRQKSLRNRRFSNYLLPKSIVFRRTTPIHRLYFFRKSKNIRTKARPLSWGASAITLHPSFMSKSLVVHSSGINLLKPSKRYRQHDFTSLNYHFTRDPKVLQKRLIFNKKSKRLHLLNYLTQLKTKIRVYNPLVNDVNSKHPVKHYYRVRFTRTVMRNYRFSRRQNITMLPKMRPNRSETRRLLNLDLRHIVLVRLYSRYRRRKNKLRFDSINPLNRFSYIRDTYIKSPKRHPARRPSSFNRFYGKRKQFAPRLQDVPGLFFYSGQGFISLRARLTSGSTLALSLQNLTRKIKGKSAYKSLKSRRLKVRLRRAKVVKSVKRRLLKFRVRRSLRFLSLHLRRSLAILKRPKYSNAFYTPKRLGRQRFAKLKRAKFSKKQLKVTRVSLKLSHLKVIRQMFVRQIHQIISKSLRSRRKSWRRSRSTLKPLTRKILKSLKANNLKPRFARRVILANRVQSRKFASVTKKNINTKGVFVKFVRRRFTVRQSTRFYTLYKRIHFRRYHKLIKKSFKKPFVAWAVTHPQYSTQQGRCLTRKLKLFKAATRRITKRKQVRAHLKKRAILRKTQSWTSKTQKTKLSNLKSRLNLKVTPFYALMRRSSERSTFLTLIPFLRNRAKGLTYRRVFPKTRRRRRIKQLFTYRSARTLKRRYKERSLRSRFTRKVMHDFLTRLGSKTSSAPSKTILTSRTSAWVRTNVNNFSFYELKPWYKSPNPRFWIGNLLHYTQLIFKPRHTNSFTLPSHGFMYIFQSGSPLRKSSVLKAQLFKDQYSFSYLLNVKRYIMRRFTKRRWTPAVCSLNPQLFQSRKRGVFSFDTTNYINTISSRTPAGSWLWRINPNTDISHLLSYTSEPRFPSTQVRIKRIRFKPGYSRLWRSARSTLQSLLDLSYRYQARLTLYIFRFYRSNRYNKVRYSNLFLGHILTRVNFSNDLVTSQMLLQWESVYLNGRVVSSLRTLLFINDFIQLVINVKYYIAYRWIVNWALKKKQRVLKLRFLKYKAGAGKGGKQVSFNLPNWLLGYKDLSFDIPKYLEVDYFTLSAFIIYEPFMYSDLNMSPLVNTKNSIINMYNWKYIT